MGIKRHAYLLTGTRAGRDWRYSGYFVCLLIATIGLFLAYQIKVAGEEIQAAYCGHILSGQWPDPNNDKINCEKLINTVDTLK